MATLIHLQTLKKQLTCPLCDNLLRDPTSSSSCGHCFCNTCITTYISTQHDSKPGCPTCHAPIQQEGLYFNHKCQEILSVVQGLVSPAFAENKETQSSAANKRQLDAVCSEGKGDRKSAPQQPGVFSANDQQQVSCKVAVQQQQQQQPQQALLAATEDSNAVVTGSEQIKTVSPGSLNAHSMLNVDELAAPIAQASPPRDSIQEIKAASTQAAGPLQNGQLDLQAEHLPACLLRFDQEWAASIAALPSPDEAETAVLGMELLALEAVMTDFQRLLQAQSCKGYTETADAVIETQIAEAAAASPAYHLSAVSPAAAALTAQRQHGNSPRQQEHLGHAAGAQVLLSNTDNSLSAIDAMMQARGYRLSCMPGPSALPATAPLSEPGSPSGINTSPDAELLEDNSDTPACSAHETGQQDTALPSSAGLTAKQRRPESCDKHADAVGSSQHEPDARAPQSASSQPAGQPKDSAAALTCGKIEELQQDSATPQVQASAEAQKQCADAVQEAKPPLPAEDLSADSTSKASPSNHRTDQLSQHEMPASPHDVLVLPDSAGPSQQPPVRQHHSLSDAVINRCPSSQTALDIDSMEAALALASLAAAAQQDIPVPRGDAAYKADQAETVQPGHRGDRPHKHCSGNRMPLKVVQKTAVFQRQPLKPAWQNPGKAGASWGAKGRRTGLHRGQPCRRNRHAHDTDSPVDEGGQQANAGLSSKAAGSGDINPDGRHMAVRTGDGNRSGQPCFAYGDGNRSGQPSVDTGSASRLQNNITDAPSKDGMDPAETHSPCRQQPQQPQQQCTSPKCGTAAAGLAQQACSKGSNADDDDFKPDVRRRARGPGSPDCSSRKRVKLSAEKLPNAAEQLADAGQSHAMDLVGQALLCWNSRRQQWDQKIITSCGDSKGTFHVVSQSAPTELMDLTEVQWIQAGQPATAKLHVCQLLQQPIKVWWPDDRKYYQGAVAEYMMDKGLHRVLYDDGEEEELNMAEEKFRFCWPLPKVVEQHTSTDTSGSADGRPLDAELPDAPKPTALSIDMASGAQPMQVSNAVVQPQSAGNQAEQPKAIAPASDAVSLPQPLLDTSKHAAVWGSEVTAAAADSSSDALSKGDSSKSAAQAAREGQVSDRAPAEIKTPAVEAPLATRDSQGCQAAADAYDYPGTQAGAVDDHCPQEVHQPQSSGSKRQQRVKGTAAKGQKRVAKRSLPVAQNPNAAKVHQQPLRKASRLAKSSLQPGPIASTAPTAEDGAAVAGVQQDSSKQHPPVEPHDNDQQLQRHLQLPVAQEIFQPAEEQLEAPKSVTILADKKVLVGSGLDRSRLDQIKRLCRRLRAETCKAVDQHTTHVILQVNQDSLCQQRSLKYFQGLARGCWLVSWAWLEACAAAGCWVPEAQYEVQGDHFALGAPKAARVACQSGAPKVFAGLSFCMSSNYNGTGMSPQQLTELLTHAGGQVLPQTVAQLTDCKLYVNGDKLHVILFGEGNVEHDDIQRTEEHTGHWPLLLTWVLDSLSSQRPLPVMQYEEPGRSIP